MATLHIVKGARSGTRLLLDTDRFLIGRNPECDFMLSPSEVSKRHAVILRIEGKFYIEDLGSRNHTYVNGHKHAGPPRVPLKNNDYIRIYDFEAVFLEDDEGGEDSSSSSVKVRVPHSSVVLETQPAESLRGLLELGAVISKTLTLDELLPGVANGLLQLFRKADRAFLILDDKRGPRAHVVKTRVAQSEASARYSRTIVRKCLESAEGFLSVDTAADVQCDGNQSVVEACVRSVICAPIVNVAGKAFGALLLDSQDNSKRFNKADLDLLCGVANQVAIAVDNARMHADALAQERARQEMALARDVHLSFLPEALPVVPGYEFHAVFQPANAVGGDYYDFIPLADGRVVMTVGDVAGKGVPAALLMAKLSAAVRYSFLAESDPARAVGRLNDVLFAQCRRIDRFVSLAACVINPATHVATLVSGGHPPPLLYRSADGSIGECMPRACAGTLLGIVERYQFQSVEIMLLPGDAVLLYSDGVTDAQAVGGRRFGAAKFLQALKKSASGSPHVLIDGVLQAVEKHSAGANPYDDITIAALGRTE